MKHIQIGWNHSKYLSWLVIGNYTTIVAGLLGIIITHGKNDPWREWNLANLVPRYSNDSGDFPTWRPLVKIHLTWLCPFAEYLSDCWCLLMFVDVCCCCCCCFFLLLAVVVVVVVVVVVPLGYLGDPWVKLPGNYRHWNWELPTGGGRGLYGDPGPWGLWIQKASHDDDASGLLLVINCYWLLLMLINGC